MQFIRKNPFLISRIPIKNISIEPDNKSSLCICKLNTDHSTKAKCIIYFQPSQQIHTIDLRNMSFF